MTLHVDHILPVCQGGTNDIENLITACSDCNLGKSGRTISQAAPTEEDRLRLAQERNEQLAALETARQASQARERLRQEIVNFWCDQTWRDHIHGPTLDVIFRYVEEFGVSTVFEWIEIAARRFPSGSDQKLGKYISGIRNRILRQRGSEGDA